MPAYTFLSPSLAHAATVAEKLDAHSSWVRLYKLSEPDDMPPTVGVGKWRCTVQTVATEQAFLKAVGEADDAWATFLALPAADELTSMGIAGALAEMGVRQLIDGQIRYQDRLQASPACFLCGRRMNLQRDGVVYFSPDSKLQCICTGCFAHAVIAPPRPESEDKCWYCHECTAPIIKGECVLYHAGNLGREVPLCYSCAVAKVSGGAVLRCDTCKGLVGTREEPAGGDQYLCLCRPAGLVDKLDNLSTQFSDQIRVAAETPRRPPSARTLGKRAKAKPITSPWPKRPPAKRANLARMWIAIWVLLALGMAIYEQCKGS